MSHVLPGMRGIGRMTAIQANLFETLEIDLPKDLLLENHLHHHMLKENAPDDFQAL